MSYWEKESDKYLMNTVKRLPITLVRGKGARVWDDRGNEYLDFVAGWAVDSLGHCHPVVVKALEKQSKTLIQVSNQFYSTPQIRLARLLVRNSCFQRAFFCNSGAEANEGAVKLARRYGKLKKDGAYEVITTTNSFHGRTLAMTAATGQAKFQEPYTPLPVGFVNVPYNDIEAIRKATSKSTCAIMLEIIQAEGGVHPADTVYLKKVREWCDRQGILLIFDEIQTGMCRTGPLFAYQDPGIEPDIITLAKGLGSGVPIGAFLAREHCSLFSPGEHGSTFGGNPLTCAVAFSVLTYMLRTNMPAHVRETGSYLQKKLLNLKARFGFIREVRGKGLLWAVEFKDDRAEAVTAALLKKGLLVNKVKPNALRLMPPLIITKRDVDEAVGIMSGVLNS